jgi:protein TonB
VQGTVVVECTLTPEGRVADMRVVRGHTLLNEAALRAVEQWLFTPTLLNGVPVPVILTVTVNFQLG